MRDPSPASTGDRLASQLAGTEGTGLRPRPRLTEPENTDPEWDRAAEGALVSRIVAGDQDACAALLDRYQGRVYRMVRRMWSREMELAEDLTQEVFLRVFRGLPRFQLDCALGTWIHRIAINVCISELRQRKALKRDRPTISLDAPIHGSADGDPRFLDPASTIRGPSEESEREELYRACRAAIDELPELWRVILTLRDLEDRSYEEIAEILKLPIGTVRSRLHRARARVRARLESEAGGQR